MMPAAGSPIIAGSIDGLGGFLPFPTNRARIGLARAKNWGERVERPGLCNGKEKMCNILDNFRGPDG
jgi:hypothetical protein